METKSQKPTTENFVKDIRSKTRRLITSEQKILIVMEAIRGETPVAELCRKYGSHQTQLYQWNKEFLEAEKKRLAGDTTREATSSEVDDMGKENQKLKELLANIMLRRDIVKKSLDMFEKLNG